MTGYTKLFAAAERYLKSNFSKGRLSTVHSMVAKICEFQFHSNSNAADPVLRWTQVLTPQADVTMRIRELGWWCLRQ